MKILGEMFISEGWQESENGPCCRLRANPAHPVYQVHFPSQPVTPGVCLLQLAGELLAERLQRPLYLKAVKNAKFLALLVPAAEKRVMCRILSVEQQLEGCKAQLHFCDEAMSYAKFSLLYTYERH